METKKDRLEQFIRTMGYSTREFERAIGVSNGTVRHITDALSANLKEKISANFPQLNLNWLLTGNGDMLRSSVTLPSETNTKELRRNYEGRAERNRALAAENPTDDREMTERRPREDRDNPNLKRLPLVTQTAVAGFGNANFAIHEADVKEYYVVPKFRYHQVDFMIELSGSSMYPKYNSGDVVACTILRDGAFIQWNKCHIIATREQGILCKRLMPGSTESSLKMVSDNENYPPFEVPKDEITGIALVVGVIRLE
mgnify:CR=1 FL=1